MSLNTSSTAVDFTGGGMPVQEHELDAIEREYGVTLPPSYRELLQAHNGGHVSPRSFWFRGLRRFEHTFINYVVSTNDDLGTLRAAWNCWYGPEEVRPIAYCGFGYQLLLTIAGDSAGSLSLRPIRYSLHIYPVARSIAALLDRLQEDPPFDVGSTWIRRRGPALRGDDLALVERRLNASLPPRYREFLLEYNGGVTVPRGVPNADFVDCFFCVRAGPEDVPDLIAHYKQTRALLPSSFLPIAECYGGGYLLIQLGGSKDDTVFYWEEDSTSPVPVSSDVYSLLASMCDVLISEPSLDGHSTNEP